MAWVRRYKETSFVGSRRIGWRVPNKPSDKGNYLLSIDDDGVAGWRATTASSLELGETEDTAYRGDRGKIAYDHSQQTSDNPHNVTKEDVGLGNLTNDKQIPYSEKGANNGVATLDDNGKVPSAQ